MAVIQIDTEILKAIVKESVAEAINQERLKLYDSIIPPVSDSEMESIISLYGNKPPDTKYTDATEWFENAD